MPLVSAMSVCRLLLLSAILLLVAACSESPTRIQLPTSREPVPSVRSPEEAIRFLEWSWERRDSARYAEIVAADFRFVFSALDPAGNAYRDDPWTREDELISLGHLFHGGPASQPPVTTISLTLDRNFVVSPDPRPGKHPTWHRKIRSSLILLLTDANQGQWNIAGFADFYLVRGDSAAVPEELQQQGIEADSTRWFLERWEDGTMCGEGRRAAPAQCATLGLLKTLYR